MSPQIATQAVPEEQGFSSVGWLLEATMIGHWALEEMSSGPFNVQFSTTSSGLWASAARYVFFWRTLLGIW